MKQQNIKSLIAVLALTSTMFILEGCSNLQEETQLQQSVNAATPLSQNENRAIQIANKTLHRTRGTASACNISPVLRKAHSTRSHHTESSDTLAFIINYTAPNAFAIVANRDIDNPVLAFSEKNQFSEDVEAPSLYFVDNIQTYLDNYSNIPKYDSIPGFSQPEGTPVIKTNLGFAEPYNKVIARYHPNCNASVCGVACAMLLSYAEKEITFKNYHYNFTEINKNIIAGENSGIISFPTTNSTPSQNILNSTNGEWPNNIFGAIDAMSQLLYDLGVSMGDMYTEQFTISLPRSSYNQLKNMGCEVTPFYQNYSDSRALELLSSGWLIYQSGNNLTGKYGHSWAMDGYSIEKMNNADYYTPYDLN